MKKILMLLSAVCMSITLAGGHVYAEEPQNTKWQRLTAATYYVDDVNGNDKASGTSEQTAWKSLNKVNETTFLPGNKICFKAGGKWSGMLHPLGSGSSGAPIILDQYGVGNKPLIQGNGAEAGIKLESQEYWTIRNFEVTNKAAQRGIRQGIFINGKTDGITHGITIEDCEVHDVTGENRRDLQTYKSMYWNSGIYVSMPGRSTSSVHYDGVFIKGNYVHDVLTSGIRINQREDFIVDQYHTNVVIEGNTISRTGSDGMIVANSILPLIQYNLCYDAGALGNSSDTKIIAGLWTCGTDDALFQYNEVARTVLFESDGTAFDTDWGTGGVTTFQYNYTHGNQGGFWLDCAGINKDPEHIKTVLRYNVSVDDERYIVRAGDMPTELYNNTFYKSQGKLDACFGNAGKNHKFYNNIFYFNSSPDWASSVYENNLYYPCDANQSDLYAVAADPQFVSPGPAEDGMGFADHFKMKDTSPGIGRGVYLPDNGGKDFFGNALNKGSYDIGAHQTTVTGLIDEDTYVFTRDFATSQGDRGWYYMEAVNGSYQNMSWDDNQKKWKGSGVYNLIWAPGNMHPDGNDTVLAWKAQKAGTIQVVGNPKKISFGNDGVNVKILKGTTQVWPGNGWQLIGGSDATGISHNFTVDVKKDEMLYFVLNKNGTNYSDGTYWNPLITYKVVEKYSLAGDFSNVQGNRGWYYLETDNNGYQQMTWDSSVNRWKGKKQYSLIWSPAQLHPDTSGMTHQLTTRVLAGDFIYFLVNQNGSNAGDEISWNPVISFD